MVTKQGQLRIIGGEWRSRKLTILDAEGLRPTPDRVRETLFNWLAPYIEGASVLDLFAGSGALSLEALSRGASHATLLDVNVPVINHLKKQIQLLNCQKATLLNQSALLFLDQPITQTFDLVFLDPPFGKAMLEPCCKLLVDNKWLTDDAWVYTESELSPSQLVMPRDWTAYREKKAGQVYYTLWRIR